MSWQRVRGHDAVVESFRRALRRGRLGHAYLFTGPAGVGKHLFVVELAKALLCESAPPVADAPGSALEACDTCPACIQVEAGTHPDFFRAVRPEDKHEFPIEMMRELCQAFSLKSARGRGKVVLVDDADDLNEESANCFLKTLEEPPPRSVLILIGSTPDRQLPTVVSRCQVIRFAPLAPGDVEAVLAAGRVDDAVLRQGLVSLSGGSPGFALLLADSALQDFRRRLLDALSCPGFDSVALAKDWITVVEKAGKESAAQRARAKLLLRLLIDFLTDALAVSQGNEPRRSEPADRPALGALTTRVGSDVLIALLERCLEADEQIDRRVQLVLVLEALLDALAQKLETVARLASGGR
jgi:DNA polymerase-3 subunit delta'